MKVKATVAENIVVGVDGSSGCKVALSWARRFRPTAAIQPVTAWSYPLYGGTLPDVIPYEQFKSHAEQRAEQVSDEVSKQIGNGLLAPLLLEGHAGQVLITAASDADLLVVGTRGHGFVKDVLLGSVSQFCVKRCAVPVVVVPESATDAELNDVVVGLDQSDHAERALSWAIMNAPSGSRIRIVQAWHPSAHVSLEVMALVSEQLEESAKKHLAEAIEGHSLMARKNDITLEGYIARGDARRVLRDHASGADLLVIGARGRDGLAHLLVGSVTTSLVDKPELPIAVIR